MGLKLINTITVFTRTKKATSNFYEDLLHLLRQDKTLRVINYAYAVKEQYKNLGSCMLR